MAIRSGTQRRRDAILGMLKTGSWSIPRLAGELGTSESTIRRDLRELAADGQIIRTIGGAAAGGYVEPPLGERMEQQAEAKDAIAALALERLDDGARTVFLDAGSTTVRLAERIRDRSDLTVFTRGLEIALALAHPAGPRAIMVGGEVSTLSHGTTGALSDHALSRIHVDIAFLGADAVDPTQGLGEPSLDEARTKELIAERAGTVIVLADSSKSGRDVAAWAPMPTGWTWIDEHGEHAQS
ncbi:DNA-binding transcriptional regulator of sugar metabolism, DeoR/GlpR family [Brevibacterium siliguriense]|uniref:DNA-binding transcriptional regulator of sugar metabolism, DeoR/GlpR family n=1 Tax=Brevibacterium siliguriense TaxID=1136497 RepID=A0A1H1W4S2_9MICO|nr:DeoR/GlpR family DNA-binding transcription regulator [Brevibacterium siliguriense]SDS92055.1 DNA-binding transcriptional regulator of sugar metabolism, DeoR/GlpR family [Brevibacterium siliguriense]